VPGPARVLRAQLLDLVPNSVVAIVGLDRALLSKPEAVKRRSRSENGPKTTESPGSSRFPGLS